VKNYYVYKIYFQPFNPELLSGILWEFDIAGLIEEDDHLKIFTTEDSNISQKAIEDSLIKLKEDNLINSFNIEKELFEDKNWNELWEKSREVIRVSNRIVIKPSFKEYTSNENEIVLTIDPKMSFGTGEHQSTKLVLRLLEKYVKKGMKVLDVGSGTGILSIAAVKLGATSTVAIDFDEICLDNCKENCVLNGVENSIEILAGEIDIVQENNFDLVLANIHKNVLIDISEKIKSRLRENGKVILAGLLESDKKDIVTKYHSLGFRIIQIEQMDEWIAIVFTWVKE
jgi:ribosomal protein L11 methyltransferase